MPSALERSLALGLLLLAGCAEKPTYPLVDARFGSARLSARPSTPASSSTRTGLLSLHALEDVPGEARVAPQRVGVLFVPECYRPETPAPLVLLLHGAGDAGRGILPLVRERAEASCVLVLAPDSQGRTWDFRQGEYGPDVRALDQKLQAVFRRYAVDPRRIGIGGFSDGASYALSLGLSNGDLFQRIAAFSPGFVAATELRERPRVYLSHGTRDLVLPIDRSGRYIAALLKRAAYTVVYREFDGPHTVPEAIAAEGFAFLLGQVVSKG